MQVSKKALWFGWFEQNLEPPWEPAFMRKEREEREREEARKKSAAKQSRKRAS